MGKLKGFGKKLSDAAKNTAKKSEELIEIGKVKAKIRDAENDIEKTKMEIGEIAYKKFKDGEATFAEAEEMGTKIDGFLDDIKDFEEKILRLKHVRICPDCGEEVEDIVAFCSKCGHKFEPLPAEEKEEVDDVLKCKSCGAELEEGVAFCGKCGAKVE
jgi:DNA-directed RNA polymerase subunit RPC12/RpoP